jgi:hypothetical protein
MECWGRYLGLKGENNNRLQKTTYEVLHNWYSSPTVVCVSKLWSMRREGHAIRTEEKIKHRGLGGES